MDHFEAVGVEPEFSASVEIAEEFPVDYDVLAGLLLVKVVEFIVLLLSFEVGDGNVVEIDLELQKVGDFGEFDDCGQLCIGCQAFGVLAIIFFVGDEELSGELSSAHLNVLVLGI